MITTEAVIGSGKADPRALLALLMAGQQDNTITLAKAFDEAGEVAGDAYRRGRGAHTGIGESFTNDGAPVLDAAAQSAQAWRLLGQGGTDMSDTAYMLKRAAEALDGAQGAGTTAVNRMIDDVNGLVMQWNTALHYNLGQFDPAALQQTLDNGRTIVDATADAVQAVIDGYDKILIGYAADLDGRGYSSTPAPVDPLSADAASRDGTLFRTGTTDPDAADAITDEATRTLQGIAAQLTAGTPLTAAQRDYITAFSDAAGTDALAAIPDLAALDGQSGADRAESALAGGLSALTKPDLGGTADIAALPTALRRLTEDPFAGIGPESSIADVESTLRSLPRYEGLTELLGATSVPLGTDYGVAAGQQAIRTSQFAAQVAGDPLALGAYFRTQPPGSESAILGRLRSADTGASNMLTNVSRNLDTAQALVGDVPTRNALLTSRAVDTDGAVALLDRATARVAPTPEDAVENADITARLFTDLAQDPYGWRDVIDKGGPISNELTSIVTDHIDAFGSRDNGMAEVFGAAAVPGGYHAGVELGSRDAEDVLTFVAAGRDIEAPYDPDLLRVHAAADAYTQQQVAGAIAGTTDPVTALGRAGSVAAAVNAADFRTAVQAYGDVDDARTQVYDHLSTVAGIGSGQLVEAAAGALPGWIGDTLSTAVDKAVESFEPTDTAGQKGNELTRELAGRQVTDLNHLLAQTYEQTGTLSPDTPDLDTITDDAGRVAPLESFRDDDPDPDVTTGERTPRDALATIARNGPAGGDPNQWDAAAREYEGRASVYRLDPDYANPEPRTPLNPDDVDRWRDSTHPDLPVFLR